MSRCAERRRPASGPARSCRRRPRPRAAADAPAGERGRWPLPGRGRRRSPRPRRRSIVSEIERGRSFADGRTIGLGAATCLPDPTARRVRACQPARLRPLEGAPNVDLRQRGPVLGIGVDVAATRSGPSRGRAAAPARSVGVARSAGQRILHRLRPVRHVAGAVQCHAHVVECPRRAPCTSPTTAATPTSE